MKKYLIVILFSLSFASCEKEQANPTGIPDDIIKKIDHFSISTLPLAIPTNMDGYHFQFSGANVVNTATAYLREGGVWYDVSHPKMRNRFNGIRWEIVSSDTTWTMIQANTDENYGKMIFGTDLNDYEEGICDFIQPCSIFTFDFRVRPLTGFPPEPIELETHSNITTRTNPSEGVPNQSCS